MAAPAEVEYSIDLTYYIKQEAFAAYCGEHRACKRWWVNFQEGVMYFEE